MKKFHLFFLCACLLNLVSCNFELEDIPRQKQLVDITLDTDDALIDYPQNAKELNKRGIKIFGHYSDGSTQKENIEDAKFSGFDSTERGTITIDVEFKGIHKNFDINIGNDDPDYLEILNYPIKLLYWEEEYNKNIDLNGLEVVVHFLSGEFKKVDNKVFTIEKSTRLDKNRTIKICYNNDVFATFDVYVFNDKDFKDSVSTSSPLINYIKLVDSGSLNTINYRIGESIKLDGVNIDVKDLHNMKLCTIPCTQCYITEKKVIQNKENATVCINGKNHNIMSFG